MLFIISEDVDEVRMRVGVVFECWCCRCLDNRVFVALGNGNIVIYKKDACEYGYF